MPEGNPYNLAQILGFLTSGIFQKVKTEISSLSSNVESLQDTLTNYGTPTYVNTPVGTIIWSVRPYMPNTTGYLACDGSSRTESGFPELASFLGVDQEGNFTLPNITPETKGGTTLYAFIKHEKTSY
jgi:hypothetical protein